MEDSIFTKIIKGDIPAHKVYEDDRTIAIVPLHPIGKGHVLVIPKRQVDEFFALPEADYLALMDTVKKVAQRLKEVLHTKRVGIQVVGLDIPHVHVHVIAFDSASEYYEHPDETIAPDHEKLAALAQKFSL